MQLNNKLDDFYENICNQTRKEGTDNPFTLELFDRIVSDLEQLEGYDKEYELKHVRIGSSNGVELVLSVKEDVKRKYQLEYLENNIIYWRLSDPSHNYYSEGYSTALPITA